MKVSTDSVLLGAWASIEGAKRILDVGTGCGIIALMVAQRSEAKVDAIDPDTASVEEAAKNFASAPWHDRLKVWESSIQSWEPVGIYDHILSNPPYFQHHLPSPCQRRNLARHAQELTPFILASHFSRLLLPKGQASMVLRASSFPVCQVGMNTFGFHLHRICRIRNSDDAAVKLMLATYSRMIPAFVQTENLILTDGDGRRSGAYIKLTQDFYL